MHISDVSTSSTPLLLSSETELTYIHCAGVMMLAGEIPDVMCVRAKVNGFRRSMNERMNERARLKDV